VDRLVEQEGIELGEFSGDQTDFMHKDFQDTCRVLQQGLEVLDFHGIVGEPLILGISIFLDDNIHLWGATL